MHKLVSKLREKRAQDENGFTLIELLVVVAILGVLIAIAIPLYLNYRKGANDSATQSDVRNAISVLEVCNASNASYPALAAGTTWTTATVAPCAGQQINLSSGTSLKYTSSATTAPATSYILVGTNANGAVKFYCYNSASGGAVTTLPATVTTLSASTATC
jgi:type IV pilus assembly protein PilA